MNRKRVSIYRFKLSSFRNRFKRDDINIESTFNLFINILIVADRTIYKWFQETYSMMSSNMPLIITNYIKIFFCNLVNGVNIQTNC